MNTKTASFRICGNEVSATGCEELKECTGILKGDGIAFFYCENKEFYIANTITGKVRKFSSGGNLLVDDIDIDFKAIAGMCENGVHNARSKSISYADIYSWDGFKDGICAISWMLYPDGRYFADSDGYGMEDNDEEDVYAIIDTDLNIVEPFRPIKDVTAYLKEIRKNHGLL